MSARILLVENDEAHRTTVVRHLEQSGHEVVAVDSAEVALNRISEVDPEIVISDGRLPGLSGLELLQKVKSVEPDIDFILVTAFDSMQGAIDAMKEGAFEYLGKPLDIDAFDDAIDRCLTSRRGRRDANPDDTFLPTPNAENVIVGHDPKMLDIYKTIGKVAATHAPVLVRGETGTGKELVSRVIHENSGQPDEPFLPVNCAAIPEPLLESELFGHVEGAYTGAVSARKGRFELARSGTIFLDEIGDMPPALQAKLLRVLQDGEVYPLGSEVARPTDARVVAATNRPIEQLIEEGTFREDLYYRLRVIEITIPPLRERRDDIPLLARHILTRANEVLGKSVEKIPEPAMGLLLSHNWPGNVRELQNAIMRAVVLSSSSAISAEDLDLGPKENAIDKIPKQAELEELERIHVQRTLAEEAGNKSATARALGISRPRLDRMIDRHGLVVPH